MGETSIEWTDATWNPTRGCSVISPGCKHCYAMAFAARFTGPGMAYEGLAEMHQAPPRTLRRDMRNGQVRLTQMPGKKTGRWTGKLRLIDERLADPLRWKEPKRIFVNSMSDLFHEKLTNEEIAVVFGVMSAAPQHTFQTLTKRAKRMQDWFAWLAERSRETGLSPAAHVRCITEGKVDRADRWWTTKAPGIYRVNPLPSWPLPNVWLGVSVEDRKALERLQHLRATPAAVRFVSFEPLLEDLGDVDLKGIDWAIIGGESGRGARPMQLEWARGLLACARRDGAAPFVKQLGAKPQGVGGLIKLRSAKGGDQQEMPADLRVREWPRPRAAPAVTKWDVPAASPAAAQ